MGRFCGGSGGAATRGATFRVTNPLTGVDMPTEFESATAADLDRACWKAWEAFHALRDRPPADRANLLESIGVRLLELGDSLTSVACAETGLSAVKIVAERERAIANIRELALRTRRGDWISPRIETGEPSRRPTPRPDLRSMCSGMGPALIIGCGPSPILSGPAGTDAMCALAAGCPILCKSHPERAATDELVGWAIVQALESEGFHPATCALLHAGANREAPVVERLVKHPCVRIIAMQGTREAVEAVGRLCAHRPDPAPLLAIMGTTNPVFALSGAIAASRDDIADRLVSAVTSSSGQSCLRPGLLFLERGGDSEGLLQRLGAGFNACRPQPMISRRARRRFGERVDTLLRVSGVELVGGSVQAGHGAGAGAIENGPVMVSPVLMRADLPVFKKSGALHEHIPGPALLAVMCRDGAELVDGAGALQASLASSVWLATKDAPTARRLVVALERRVGRLIFNGLSPGLEFSEAMVHGGAFPASTTLGAGYGPDAVLRFMRPICYQNAPDAFLPRELRAANPLRLMRRLNGRAESPEAEAQAA